MPVSNDSRLLRAREWLSGLASPATLPDSIRPASSDASFRRYFRVDTPQGNSLVLMDAPPGREPLHSFLHVAQLLDAAGVRVPGRLAVNEAEGYLLLEDFGNDTYLPLLKTESAGGLYRDAWLALIKIQSWSLLQTPQALNLPKYDKEKLTLEMLLFEAWYVEKHLGASLNEKEKKTLAETLEALCTKALAQPQVLVHRDYHSRNLMRLASGPPAYWISKMRWSGPSPTTWSRCCEMPTSSGKRTSRSTGPCATGKTHAKQACRSQRISPPSGRISNGWVSNDTSRFWGYLRASPIEMERMGTSKTCPW